MSAAVMDTEAALSELAHQTVISEVAPADLAARLARLSPLAGPRLTQAWSGLLWAVKADVAAREHGSEVRQAQARSELHVALAVAAGRLA